MSTLNLSNHFLLAMPHVNEHSYKQTVVYIYEHNDTDGVMGIIINKPLQIDFFSLLKHLNMDPETSTIPNHKILMGGPIHPDNGFILYEDENNQEINISASKDMLIDIAKNDGPKNYLISLGYTDWDNDKINTEIANNDWMIVPYSRTILFDLPFDERWSATPQLLGIDMHQLASHEGHA